MFGTTSSSMSGFGNLGLRQWLFISCVFSCMLATVRIIATGHLTFLFLVWNLFLAFIPFAITEWIDHKRYLLQVKSRLTFVLVIWLLFIPNTFYIITDLFHLNTFDTAPKWFDLLLIFSFAWNGIILGILSIRKVEVLLTSIIARNLSSFFIFLIMLLNAFGIYVGRYLRFNSWDILAQPSTLLRAMAEVMFHPLRNSSEWVMIAFYAAFMTLAYITIQKTSESFHQSNQS